MNKRKIRVSSRHRRLLKITAVAYSISLALAPFSASTIVTSTTTANSGQEITLTPEEQYVTNNRYALIANSGKITGDNISVTTNINNSTYSVISAANGGKVILTNSSISYLNPTNGSYSADHSIAIRADGLDTLVDISNSTIESFNRLLQVTNGATAKLHNNTIVAHRYGLQTWGEGSSMHITDSDITFLGAGIALASRNGALLTISDSDIHGVGNYGIALSWDSNISPVNQTSASTGIIDNVTIETQNDSNRGYGLWLISRSQAFMSNSYITINGNQTSGIFADKSQEMSEVRNTTIEMLGSNVDSVVVKNGSQILLADKTKIITHGDNSSALYSHHNNGATATKLVATDVDIRLEGSASYGALAESDGSEIYLDDIRLTVNGNSSVGLMAKEAGTILHANRVNAQINGASSTGMRVQNGANAQLNNSQFNITGAGSTGVAFNNTNIADSNSMQITGSYIETQDGYAIKNEGGALDLTLNDTTIIGRTGGEQDIAIGTNAGRSGSITITTDNSHIIGDINLRSNNASASSDVTLNNASTFTGNLFYVDSLTLNSASQWNIISDANAVTLNNNSGIISFVSPGDNGSFKTLTVGDYNGGGTIIINTTLGDDTSQTDRLIVTGDTTGNTNLIVNNFRGNGNDTVSGIEVITVNGQSDGVFTLQNRAVAGAYEYLLHQDNGNWYLRSQAYSGPFDPSEPVYRPEVGSYIANTSAAGRLFNVRLEDREGRAQDSSLWLRQVGSRNKFRDSSGQLHTANNAYVVQGGGEVWQSRIGESGRLGLGMMAGYGRTSGETRSDIIDHIAKNSVNGYSTGVYATWYQNAETLNGAYLDSWLQYGWFDAEVSGDKRATEQYDIDGLSASIEAGYRLALSENSNSNVYLTPQSQIIWNNMKADTHYEADGTQVNSSGDDNIQTRLGVKLALEGVNDYDVGKDKLFSVYAEANWIYNSKQTGVVMDGITMKQAGNRHVGELKLGFEGQLNKHVNVWTNVAQQLGDNGYSDTAATLGVKYRF